MLAALHRLSTFAFAAPVKDEPQGRSKNFSFIRREKKEKNSSMQCRETRKLVAWQPHDLPSTMPAGLCGLKRLVFVLPMLPFVSSATSRWRLDVETECGVEESSSPSCRF